MTLTTTPTASKLWVAITPTTRRDETGNEQAPGDDGATTANSTHIDACRELGVVLIERALDLVEHPLFVLGERHRSPPPAPGHQNSVVTSYGRQPTT